MKTKNLLFLTVLTLLFFSCQSDDVMLDESALTEMPEQVAKFVDIGNTTRTVNIETGSSDLSKISGKHKVTVLKAEYITVDDGEHMGNTVFFSHRGNKQLDADFVPGWNLTGSTNISFYVDDNRPSHDLDTDVTNNAIDRAMNTWDDVNCSDLGMNEVEFDGRPTGFVAAAFGYEGGSFNYVADVLHAGWMPSSFFDKLAPGGSNFILGVTFTLIWGTDIDNDGRDDVAWREIYYNDNFSWNDGRTYDVETIALHEAGHGLSQAHFGKAFRSNGNGKLHFSPRAVMNAAYSGVQTRIQKTDKAGHCSNWGSWPNN